VRQHTVGYPSDRIGLFLAPTLRIGTSLLRPIRVRRRFKRWRRSLIAMDVAVL